MMIIAALDQSDRDRLVLDQARLLLSAPDCNLTIVSVMSRIRLPIPGTSRDAEVDAYVQGIQASLAQDGIVSTSEVRKGDAAAELIRAAVDYRADLVIMATRGRKGWDRMMLGSVAGEVLAGCPCAVLIVNEATWRARVDDDVRMKSGYLASVVWAKENRGEITTDQAHEEIVRLADAGLDYATLVATYQELARAGVPPAWLDMSFQMQALAQYLPSELPAAALNNDEVAA